PYIFGRGAEEAEELLEAGLEFEVVPGVTSAVAGAAYAGIPLTHRKYASSVSLITGHEDPTKPDSAHNWPALATAASTLCFYMGVKNLPYITGKLMEHGMRADMPAALVRWGTTAKHQSWVSTVGEISALAEREGIKAPSMLVVGQVVQLHDTLNWFEKLPLHGRGVVVTRAREQASGLKDTLERLGAACYEFPTITIVPLKDYGPVQFAIEHLPTYDWVVFTSVNGVRHFWNQLDALGKDARALGAVQVAAIGPATAEALCERGIRPDFVPPKYVAESVVEGLLALGIEGKRVLIPRAKVAREVLPEELAKVAARVDVLPVYETVLTQEDGAEIVDLLEKGRLHYLTFSSSSTVDNFFALVPADTLRPYVGQSLKICCIGPVTAKTLEKYGFTPDIMPEDYTIPALVDALVRG
ncbi:MAG: HemD protein, partial [Deltaproteobacteria bacterium]|nr:HemD protein [Deltaproteobacteria bacterium]